MAAFTLKIGAHFDVPVALSLRDGGRDLTFSFTLVVKRIDLDQLKALLDRSAAGEMDDRTFLRDHVVDWRGQKLVLLDDGKPAAYSDEAMDVMCSVVGVQKLLAERVSKALFEGARSLDAEKAKN